MKKTSLHSFHIQLKARMAPFAGYDMPLSYHSSVEEILSVRQKVGIFDISHMGLFEIQGTQTWNFLNEILPTDLEKITDLRAFYTLCLTPNGDHLGIEDDALIYRYSSEKVFMCVNASNQEKDWKWINFLWNQSSYKDQVKIIDHSENTSIIALQGPHSLEAFSQIFKNFEIPQKRFGVHFLNSSFLQRDSVPIFIARTGYTGEEGLEIFGNHQFIQSLWQLAIQNGIQPCGLAARDSLRVKAALPLYGHELSFSHSPYESGLTRFMPREKNIENKKSYRFFKELTYSKNHLRSILLKFDLKEAILRRDHKLVFKEFHTSPWIEIGRITSGTYSPLEQRSFGIGRVELQLLPLVKQDILFFSNKDLLSQKMTSQNWQFGVEIRDKIFVVTPQHF